MCGTERARSPGRGAPKRRLLGALAPRTVSLTVPPSQRLPGGGPRASRTCARRGVPRAHGRAD
eukprot:7926634-Alexandrium_andersonii.AAC.1